MYSKIKVLRKLNTNDKVINCKSCNKVIDKVCPFCNSVEWHKIGETNFNKDTHNDVTLALLMNGRISYEEYMMETNKVNTDRRAI